LSESRIERARYEAATHFEDVTDICPKSDGASILLSRLFEMMKFAFVKARRFPRDKDLLDEFAYWR
jgi:hypothetical protein